jgi:hypothetical protein
VDFIEGGRKLVILRLRGKEMGTPFLVKDNQLTPQPRKPGKRASTSPSALSEGVPPSDGFWRAASPSIDSAGLVERAQVRRRVDMAIGFLPCAIIALALILWCTCAVGRGTCNRGREKARGPVQASRDSCAFRSWRWC